MIEQLLSPDEIRRRLLKIRYSSTIERNARRAPSINGIATAAKLSPRMVYFVVTGDRDLTGHRNAHRRLSQALKNL